MTWNMSLLFIRKNKIVSLAKMLFLWKNQENRKTKRKIQEIDKKSTGIMEKFRKNVSVT